MTAEPHSDLTAPAGAGGPGLAYHELHLLAPRRHWGLSLAGVAMLAISVIVVVPLLLVIVFTIAVIAAGEPVADTMTTITDTTDVTPLGLLFVNLGLAAAIPVTWLLTRVVHGMAPRWLASVRPRLRWGWFAACLGLAVVSLIATLVVSALLPDQGGSEATGELNAFTSTTRDFLLVVLLLTPLQAAGEEYAFRGYLAQAVGGVFRAPWVAVVVPSVLFALAHGAQDAPIFFDRLAFGLVAGTLVFLTGGLEAGIAMHVLNNWLAFGLALAYGDMSSALNPSGGTWWSIPVTLTQSLSYLGLCTWVARRRGLQTRSVPGAVLAPHRGSV